MRRFSNNGTQSTLRPVSPQIPDRRLSPWFSMRIINGPVVRMFSVTPRLREYLKHAYVRDIGIGPGDLVIIVTASGSIEIFNVMTRRAVMVFESGLDKVTWGDVFYPSNLTQPILMVYSRAVGFYGKKLLNMNNVNEFKYLAGELHLGLCMPSSYESLLVLPSGMHSLEFFKSFSLSEGENGISPSGKMWFESSISVIRPFEDGSNLVLIGSEDGKLTVVNAFSDYPSSISIIELTKYVQDANRVTSVVPISIDGDTSVGTFVIGTDSKAIFVVKWDRETSSLEFHQTLGLVNPGISTISLRQDKYIIILGGWDGQIRCLSFPQMSRLVTLKSHSSSLKCFHFFPHATRDGKTKYFLASACEGKYLTFWDIYNKF